MKNYNLIFTKKQQKLSCEKIDKNENIAGEEIVPFNRSQIIEKVKCMYTPFGKALETSRDTIRKIS